MMKAQEKGIKWFEKSAVWVVSILFIAVSFGMVIAFRMTRDSFSILGISSAVGEGNVSDYLAVLSIHFTTVFLTTGLMSTLGAKEELVYHVDIVHRTLLKPCGRNFRDLSVYAFVTLGMAVAAFACKSAYVVICCALAGTVVISWIFFKMIDIYFGKERWRRKIIQEIEESGAVEYKAILQQLYGIFAKNLEERDVESLSRNLALLMELKAHYKNGENAWRGIIAGNMTKEIMEQNEKRADISALELYVRILGICTEDGNLECTFVLNSFFMDYVASHEDFVANWQKNDVLKSVFAFNENSPGIREWIAELRRQIALLEDKDYRAREDSVYGIRETSRFVELAGEVCKIRFLSSLFDMSCTQDSDYEKMQFDTILHAEIEDLLRCDEKRVENDDFHYLSGFSMDENEGQTVYDYTWEDELNDALFIQWFPRYAVRYGGKKAGKIISDFFRAYMERYYQNQDQQQSRDVYETMCICYLQECAEQIVNRAPHIAADTVGGMLHQFWQPNTLGLELDKKDDRSPKEQLEFYKFSFEQIGNCLLSDYDSNGTNAYHEKSKNLLAFMESLIGKWIRNYGDDVDDDWWDLYLYDFIFMDKKYVFGDFLDTLRGLSPEYYSEDVVAKVEELILT